VGAEQVTVVSDTDNDPHEIAPLAVAKIADGLVPKLLPKTVNAVAEEEMGSVGALEIVGFPMTVPT
jgi:hypothetical protein